jgi:hypothetical protein
MKFFFQMLIFLSNKIGFAYLPEILMIFIRIAMKFNKIKW